MVRNAANKYNKNFYFVSSIYDLPIADMSTYLILSIFSPIMAEEYKRVLSKQGYVVAVSPAPNHLREVAELIYETFRPHTTSIVENMNSLFKHETIKRTTFKIDIKNVSLLLEYRNRTFKKHY